jgi:hypothetical protein
VREEQKKAKQICNKDKRRFKRLYNNEILAARKPVGARSLACLPNHVILLALGININKLSLLYFLNKINIKIKLRLRF